MVAHDRLFRSAAVVVGALVLVAAAMLPLRAADIAETGLSMIPDDAAFVSATLRAREQYDRIVKSRAFQSLQALPGVRRALESLAEQRTQPGNPLSMVDAFMQMPENQQALDVLTSMVATDTFVYGEPTCIKLIELLQKVQQAQQAANIISGMSGGGLEFSDFDGIEFDQLQEDDEDDEEEDEDDDAAVRRRVRVRPARFQVLESAGSLSAEELSAQLVIETIAANLDLLVMPDVVWGFRIADKAAATTQLTRVEQLLKLAAQTSPELADAVGRKKILGGEFVTFSFDPDVAALRDSLRQVEGLEEEIEKIVDRLDAITAVFAIGIVGDRVIITLGDSTDHLEKLKVAGNGKQGLLATKPFAALLEHRGKPITGVSYASEPLMKAIAPSAAGIRQVAELSDTLVKAADLPAEAAADARRDLEATAAEYEKWLPEPGPWLAFSFLSEQGYEGYAWDWSKNSPFDGTKRLELLEHAGGAPLVAFVARAKTDVSRFDDVVTWVRRGWKFFEKHVVPTLDDDDGVRGRLADVKKQLFPLAESFVTIVRTKFVPAVADGQVGFIVDAKSKTKKLHRDLPAADAALPLLEPAIVLGVDDAKLFREGLSDLFALSDDLVDAVREIAPDSVPADYRVAEPEKAKVEGGTVWSWKLEKTGLDDQVRPTIAVGEEAAVLSLMPKQAERMIVESKLETGSQLTAFGDPLAAAVAIDSAGFVEALQPWVVYATRYGCVQDRDGSVDPDTVLDATAENPQAKDALEQAKTVFEALKCLRVTVAESKVTPEATVTHWRNVIRDVK
jgi:hypothetical protein